uniref:Tetratricopeptide TPR_2 repeat protein n=1 Tax=Solibacter usitatus (strain Ellin6076) TaxID=234267 RepID=Q01U10_SOLUE
MACERIFAAATIGLLAIAHFAPNGARAGTLESEASTSASLPASTVSHARQLLRAGQMDEADRLVRNALAGAPDDGLLCLAGEIEFRRADFAGASSAFAKALELNPENARAHWGLGRIDQLHFRADSARRRFSRAFSLNNRDIDIITSYGEYVSDAASRAILLRNVAILAQREQPERAEHAIAQLKVLERLQGRSPGRLVSPYTAYRLPLTGFHPAGANRNGLLIPVRINGGKPLRLLLDTGARGLSIDARSAKKLDLETLTAAGLRGLGDNGATGSRLALARTVSMDDLVFEECLVEVSDHSLTDAADGVAGVDLFERFQIHLDPAARVLQLTPFEETAPGSPNSISALGLRNLLLVNARLDSGKEGLFLVDTGAAFTSVDRHMMPAALQQGRPIDLQGAQGFLGGATRVGPLELQVGGRSIVDLAPVALDLRQISQIEGVEISGILGFSVLGRSSLKIDLRNGKVEFARAR